jgi:butyrate kinase
MISQVALNGYIAAIGAAGGVAYFILVVRPADKRLAVIAAFVVLAIALGAVTLLETQLGGAPPAPTHAD